MFVLAILALAACQDESEKLAEAIKQRSVSVVNRINELFDKEAAWLEAAIVRDARVQWYQRGELSQKNIAARKEVFDKSVSRRKDLAKITLLKQAMKEDRSLMLIAFPAEMARDDGDFVAVDHLYVKQVAGKESAMVNLTRGRNAPDFWLDGVSTENWVDGESTRFPEEEKERHGFKVFFINGTKTYDTAAGSQRTIRRLREVKPTVIAKQLGVTTLRYLPYSVVEDIGVIETWLVEDSPALGKAIKEAMAKVEEQEAKTLADDLVKLDSEFREWKSADGKFSAEARLLSADPKWAMLEKRSPKGKKQKVERGKLSESDNAFVEQFAAEK